MFKTTKYASGHLKTIEVSINWKALVVIGVVAVALIVWWLS